MLVNVWGKLENQNVYLEIYGEGPLDEYLKNLIIEKGLENRIKLMGRSNNMKDVLMKADAFILSSDYEGMPNALIEAMACGLPCISIDYILKQWNEMICSLTE